MATRGVTAIPTTLVEQEWEMVSASEVQGVEMLKQEGNDLFLRQHYADAIAVYTAAIEKLPGSQVTHESTKFTEEDMRAFESLEIAVRLNRALASIELGGSEGVVRAEQDCTMVLKKQAICVKAWYRRALARELMGNFQDALSDAQRVRTLEPGNPVAQQLIDRLDNVYQPSECMEQGKIDTEMTSAAIDAWLALQEEENRLRKAVKHKAQSKTRREATTRSKMPTDNLRKGERTDRFQQPKCIISSKTELLWAALTHEEECTVSNIYKKASVRSSSTYAPRAATTRTATIHRSR